MLRHRSTLIISISPEDAKPLGVASTKGHHPPTLYPRVYVTLVHRVNTIALELLQLTRHQGSIQDNCPN